MGSDNTELWAKSILIKTFKHTFSPFIRVYIPISEDMLMLAGLEWPLSFELSIVLHRNVIFVSLKVDCWLHNTTVIKEAAKYLNLFVGVEYRNVL